MDYKKNLKKIKEALQEIKDTQYILAIDYNKQVAITMRGNDSTLQSLLFWINRDLNKHLDRKEASKIKEEE